MNRKITKLAPHYILMKKQEYLYENDLRDTVFFSNINTVLRTTSLTLRNEYYATQKAIREVK